VPATPKYFKALDVHVESVDCDIKLPLVVLGEPGGSRDVEPTTHPALSLALHPLALQAVQPLSPSRNRHMNQRVY
jgi:hypothetical protein